MALTLEDLDGMTIEQAQALSFEERDALLDLVIAEGRSEATDEVSYRTGLYCDYFEEDLTRMLKLRAVRVLCRGTTSSGIRRRGGGGHRRGAVPRSIPPHPDLAARGGNRASTASSHWWSSSRTWTTGRCSTTSTAISFPTRHAAPSSAQPASPRSPLASSWWSASPTRCGRSLRQEPPVHLLVQNGWIRVHHGPPRPPVPRRARGPVAAA